MFNAHAHILRCDSKPIEISVWWDLKIIIWNWKKNKTLVKTHHAWFNRTDKTELIIMNFIASTAAKYVNICNTLTITNSTQFNFEFKY